MVINLFRKDIYQGTSLIKGLAVRTMGCLRIQKLNEYLADPLKKALSDHDPYVRKTAVLCVPKVYEVFSYLYFIYIYIYIYYIHLHLHIKRYLLR